MAVSLRVGADATRGRAVPQIPASLPVRERVLHAFHDAAAAKVLCLRAPGGYGKTTALAQWLSRDPRPVVWLAIHPGAQDAQWLAHALLDGLAERGLVTGLLPVNASMDPLTWRMSVLPAVAAALREAAAPFVVAIDDAGALSGAAWESLLESLTGSLPPGAQVALTSREAVPASLWRWNSRGQVALIGPDVLAFDAAETRQLAQTMGLTPTSEQVREVLNQTAGWPVAVYLAMLARSADGRVAPVSSGVLGGTGLAEYLREEVIGRLPADDAELLSRCSVLSVLDQEACDAVAQVTGSLARLRRLAAANQLLVPQDGAGEHFRMHPLLAEALSEQLREDRLADWCGAHAAASRAEERRGRFDSAVHHAKLAGDDDRLADLIWSRSGLLLGSGQWPVLARWLAGIDDQRLVRQCGLALSAAWTASHVGDIPRMDRLALTATERAAHAEPIFQLDADLLAATIGAEGLQQVETRARAFVEGKPVDDPWQTLSHFLLGVAMFLRDDPEPAKAALAEAYRISAAFELPVMMAHSLAGLADLALAEGHEHQALSRIGEARELAARYAIDTIATTAPIFTTSAVGYLLEGRFADARREAARALRLTALMRTAVPWHALQGRLALAHVNVALGDPERARVLFDEAGDVRGPANASPRLDRMYNEVGEQVAAVSAGLVGASALTTAEVRVLQYLPTHLSFPQIADELFVSRHTIKTQALSAYRKLGAHTRSEAIEQARKAGLLPPQ